MTSEKDSSFEGNEREQLERYRNLALISTDWFWETDENFVITYMSNSVERITGSPKDIYIGVSRFDLASADTKETLEWAKHVDQINKHEPVKNFEYKHIGTKGQSVYLRVNAVPLFHQDGTFRGYLGSTADISELVLAKLKTDEINAKLKIQAKELKAAKLAAEQLASTDVLTGLNNRRAFFDHANAIQDQAKRYGHLYSVIMLDVDFFKQVNDTHGHAIGDKALQAVADAILEYTRLSDISGRIGGEEFAIILPETGADSALQMAERLRKAISQITVPIKNANIGFTASLGVAQNKDHHLTIEEVIAVADKALYQAKKEGRNKVVLISA